MRIRLHPHHPSAESGIALIIVLIMIVVFGILAGRFAYNMKVETTLARHASFSSELDWAGRSGIEMAKWILAEESKGQGGSFDSLKNYWAGGPGSSNGPCAELVFPIPIGNAQIDRPKIIDLERKFNINLADEVILRQAMTLITADAADSATIVNSILDWRDPDRDTHPGGTESKDYETLDPPYYAKDGPFDDLTELLMVRGVTPNMFWGANAAGRVQQVFNRPLTGRRSAFDEPTYAVGMVDLFTPVSGRLININTASATVLQLIPAIDANFAQALISGPLGRNGFDQTEGTEDDAPFRSVQEVSRVLGGANPQVLGDLTRYFTTRSLVFEVHVTATAGNSHREYVALLRRNGPKDIQTLNLYWK